jgi:hypothetical protein
VEQPKRRYYYGRSTKRVEASTLDEVIKKLNDLLASQVQARLAALEMQATEARKKADALRAQADELEKSAAKIAAQV